MKKISVFWPLALLFVFSLLFHPSLQSLFSNWTATYRLFFSPQVFFLLATLFVLFREKLSLEQIGLHTKHWIRNGFLGVALGTVPYLVLFAANAILGWSHASSTAPSPGHFSIDWTSIALTFLLAPVTEELFFRGVLFFTFRQNYSLPIAVIASALLFFASHNPMTPGPLLLGLFAAWITFKRQSLLPAIVVHLMANGLPYFFSMYCPHLKPIQNWIYFQF